MAALGLRGLAVVLDLVDAIGLGNAGIHVVVTDRPRALRAELELRCPEGWVIEPLLAVERDRLSSAAYAEPSERGSVLLDVVEPRQERERPALIALNTDREWMFGPRKCAVVVVAGEDAADADAGLLELQTRAPDFWSVRTRVHRAVGADDEGTVRSELLDRLAPHVRGDRAVAARWLDTRVLRDDWVAHRLWREGPGREAWLTLAASVEGREDWSAGSFDVQEIVAPEMQAGPVWSSDPIGAAIPRGRWKGPTWPSGMLDSRQQTLVDALGAALDRDGMAELYLLPEDASTDALNQAVLTVGLLREARYELVLHLDAAEGLEGGIARCLSAAGDTYSSAGLIEASRRLQGALGELRTLVLITEASSTDLAFVRATLPRRAIVATVRALPRATFCVCGSERVGALVEWAEARLAGWALGAMRRRLERRTLPLDLRAALALARHVVLLMDSTWEESSAEAWATAAHAAGRMAVFGVSEDGGASSTTSVGYWYGELGANETAAGERIERAARALAGEPVDGTSLRWSVPWPGSRLRSEGPSHEVSALASSVDDELIDELARVIGDAGMAGEVVRRARLDPGRMPVFQMPLVFWSRVIQDARNGAIAGGVRAVADAAAKLFPENQVFRRHGSPRPSEDSHARDVPSQPPSEGATPRLESGYVPLPKYPAPSQYLVARYGVVEFIGRERELADLDAWADRPGAVAVRLLHGPGGAGKTRLLLEWVKRRRERGEDAGFLRDEGENGARVLGEAQHATVVIDYAETRSWLFELLSSLADLRTEDGPRRLRVVLLARNAADWWVSLQGRNEGVQALLADSPLPLQLEPLVPIGQRAAEFDRAARAFAKQLALAVPTEVPALDDVRFGRVLYLHMLALAAVVDSTISPDQLLDGLLEHESRFWLRRADLARADADRDCVAAFVAAAHASVGALTLRGGIHDEVQARALVGRFSAEHGEKLVPLLRQLYPHPGDGWIGGLEPDILGEALVRRLVTDRARPSWLDEAMVDADVRSWIHAFTVLVRVEEVESTIAEVYPRLLKGHMATRGAPAFAAVMAMGEHTAYSQLGAKLAEVAAAEGTAELARTLDRISQRTTMLLDLAVWVDKTLLASARTEEERGHRLNRLSIRLAKLGQREEALDATVKAVAIFRTLSDILPDTFLSHLAASLVNMGNVLSELGLRQDAVAATREAMAVYSKLDATRSTVHLPQVAATFNNLGNMLAELGEWKEAFAATQAAVTLRKMLAAARPEAHLPDLATSLNNLGMRLSELGRREEALLASEQAVALRRELAAARPDAYLPDLARSLTNLGNMLAELGRREEALGATEQAVSMFRALVRSHSDTFLPELAKSLTNLGLRLVDAEQPVEALAAIDDAVAIYHQLAKAYPHAFKHDLARSLGVRGFVLQSMGRDAEAGAAYDEGLDCIWESFEELPRAHARLLENLLRARMTMLGNRGHALLGARMARFRELLSSEVSEASGRPPDT